MSLHEQGLLKHVLVSTYLFHFTYLYTIIYFCPVVSVDESKA